MVHHLPNVVSITDHGMTTKTITLISCTLKETIGERKRNTADSFCLDALNPAAKPSTSVCIPRTCKIPMEISEILMSSHAKSADRNHVLR